MNVASCASVCILYFVVWGGVGGGGHRAEARALNLLGNTPRPTYYAECRVIQEENNEGGCASCRFSE